jgi:lipocalin
MQILSTTTALLLSASLVYATENIVLESYVGHWYQMYADNYVVKTFEKDSFCATADYRLNNDSSISLFNSQANGDATGPLSNVTGTAYATNIPGQLSVYFTPGDASPLPAPYWILSVGPIVNDLYDYAIVSDKLNASLFVLARDPTVFYEKYDAEVTEFLAESFNGQINTPVATYQGDDCHYAEAPVYVDGCPNVQPISDLDLDEYTRATWYIAQQQVTRYQTTEDLYCVLATYDADGEFGPVSVPNFDGPTIGVYNYENLDSVNGHAQGNGSVLCARILDTSKPAELLVAPCQLPNVFGGDYWVIALGEDNNGHYEWAVVSGGPPREQYEDGCTTSVTKTNGSGLWIFSRTPVMSDDNLATARQALVDLGYTLSQLLDVEQEGCEYSQAVIKPDDE